MWLNHHPYLASEILITPKGSPGLAHLPAPGTTNPLSVSMNVSILDISKTGVTTRCGLFVSVSPGRFWRWGEVIFFLRCDFKSLGLTEGLIPHSSFCRLLAFLIPILAIWLTGSLFTKPLQIHRRGFWFLWGEDPTFGSAFTPRESPWLWR